MTAAPMFLCMSHDIEAAGMKMLIAGQLVAYEVGPARDGRSKAVNLRLLNP
jgi:cold shock CspA family protein